MGFWTCKNLFASPVGFQTTFWNFGHLKTYFGKIIKNYENQCFFQHGKDAHRDSAKGALNDSSRSLICDFLEQIVFLEIGETLSKVSKCGGITKIGFEMSKIPKCRLETYWANKDIFTCPKSENVVWKPTGASK